MATSTFTQLPGSERGRKETWCLTSTETIRLIGDGREGDFSLQCSYTATGTIRLIRDGSPGRPHIVQELCESRGGRPGLSVPTSLMVSVDVKQY